MRIYNHHTRITASVIGMLLGMGGCFNHGLFEILQGNHPTNGYFIEAIGETNRYWMHGTEGAFTIIPNFLITGILVIIISLSIIVWSARYIQLKHGSTVFISLLLLLTMLGGGIGHIILYLPTWAYSTRINKSLDWWRNILSDRIRKVFSRLWIHGLVTTSISWLIVMELGIFGYFPGQTDPDAVLNIVFGFLFLSVIMANFNFICGFARDIEKPKH